MAIPYKLDDLQSHLACAPRLNNGGWWTDGTLTSVPKQTLILYDFEACPYCRKVREALSELDIDYIAMPCTRGSNNREAAIELGGKTQFPFLVDPNTDTQMYESEAIIDYLRATYGSGKRPGWQRALAPLNTLGAAISSAIRPWGRVANAGARERKQPAETLELWQFEMSPYCRKVREALNELNLVHRVRNVGKRGRQRSQLVALGGKMQVPYLVDPNTDTAMYESDAIVDYLYRIYGDDR